MPETTKNNRRLVVVSNRVADFNAKFQTGGLAVALGDALKASKGLWFGWSGDTRDDARTVPPNIEHISGLTVATIDLTDKEAEGYYFGYANRCLWPALHYRLDLAQSNEEQSEIYFQVNARFAEALMPLVTPDDIIWINDYHLIPLAEELRARGCEARIGFFLHTPFPSPEIFA
ncbi:MAG: trehalose-6-phosphate synthase, partial [Methyloceanibacter sp.]